MAKRYTDTAKWDKPWFRKLGSKGRDVWQFLLDKCDHAGFWDIDLETLSYFIGEEITLDFIKEKFQEKVEILGSKLHIKPFIEFQYGPLNPQNKAHASVLNLLSKHLNGSVFKPLDSPFQGAKDKDKDKDKDKEGGVGETSKPDFQKIPKPKVLKNEKMVEWEEIKPQVFEQAKKLHGFDDAFCERVWAKLLAYDRDKPYKRRTSAAANWFNSTYTLSDWENFKESEKSKLPLAERYRQFFDLPEGETQ